MSAVPGLFEYSGFDPRIIGGCSLWLDAADSNTITLSDSRVSQWNDKSGNGYNATQATASNRPSYSNSGIVFNRGVSSTMHLAISVPYDRSHSIFMVATTSSASQTYYIGRAQTSGGGPTFIANYTGSSLEYFNNTNRATFTASPSGTFLASYTQASGGRVLGFYNGSSSFDIAQTDTTNPSTAWSTIGNAYLTVYNNSVTGSIYELIFYVGTTLTPQQRQRVEGYLAWKWGLTSSLPAAHLYKSTPVFTRYFQPVDISGCGLWLDAADPPSLTLSGSNVTTWLDKSGNARNATGVSSPTYSVPSVVFGGSAYFTVNLDFLAGVNHYAFIVLSNTNFTNIYGALNGSGAANNNNYLHVGFATSNTYRMNFYANDFQPAITSNYRSGERNLLSFVWSNNLSKTIFANGALEATSNQAGIIGTMAGGGSIGRVVGGGQGTYTGVINEIVIFTGVLSSGQRQQIEGYLAWKWGLQGSPPVTHSFRGFPPMEPVFNPRSVDGCAFWIDAADPTTVTSNANGIITAVADKSGNGRNLTNSVGTGSAGFQLVRDANFNGLPNFSNSTTNVPLGSNSSFTLNQPTTVFTVQQVVGTSSFQDIFDSTNSTARFFGFFFLSTGNPASGNYRIFAGSTLVPTSNDTGTPTMYTSVFNTTSSAIFQNGTSIVSGTAGTGSNIGVTIGARFTNNTEAFQGRIGEVIYFNRLLPTLERQRIEGYLAHKWGLQGLLPASHAYRNIKP